MPSHWLSPAVLARRLADEKVANREVAHFILANLLFGPALYYSGVITGNPSWTILSAWEGGLIAIITIYGLTKCYDSAGGDLNPNFAVQFACLSFPIWLWTSVLVWGAYWVFRLAFWRWGGPIMYTEERTAVQASYLVGVVQWSATMLAIVGSQIVFFAWMRKSLAKVHDR
jgi:hypothetical protein